MDEPLLRLAVVAIAAAAVGGIAVLTRRWQKPTHARIDVAGLGLPPGVVVFTSTDCTKCKEALAMLRPLDIPLREVTWEIEGALLERARVSAVPLTVFVGDSGQVVDQIVGVPRRRRLSKAARAWSTAMAQA